MRGPKVVDRPLAVLATTPDDAHVWNLVAVQLELEERGFDVLCLGACTSPMLLAEVARDLRPAIIVISTINGHGTISAPALMDMLRLYQLQRASPVVIGGKLTVDPSAAAEAVEALRGEGFAAAFVGDEAWRSFDEFLEREGLLPQGSRMRALR